MRLKVEVENSSRQSGGWPRQEGDLASNVVDRPKRVVARFVAAFGADHVTYRFENSSNSVCCHPGPLGPIITAPR
jgi:hypothetical protein